MKALAIFYIATLAIQFGGSYFTQMSVTTWYQTLAKSELTPPGAAFGIVWTILYLLMAIAAWRIFRKEARGYFSHTLKPWWLQLVLGFLWSIVFFGLREPEMALIIISLTWVAVLLTIVRFSTIDKWAAYLMAPLLVWIMFASYLNGYIALYN